MDRLRKLFSKKKKHHSEYPEYPEYHKRMSSDVESMTKNHVFSPRPRSRPKYDLNRNFYGRSKRRKNKHKRRSRSFGKCPCSKKI